MKTYLSAALLLAATLTLACCTWDDNAHYTNQQVPPSDNTETTAGVSNTARNPYASGATVGNTLGR